MNKRVSDGLLILAFEGLKDIANCRALTILHGASHDVCVVREPVIGSQVLNIGLGKHFSNVVVIVALIPEGSLLSDIGHRITDHLRAVITTLRSGCVRLFVILLEINDGLNDSR